jgi:hypothetical protein
MTLLLSLLWLASSCVAEKLTIVPIEHETLTVLGWNRACSVAIDLRGYPFLGDASVQDPVMLRVGSITIAPGSESATAQWLVVGDGVYSWDPAEAAAARAALKQKGYTRAGYSETLRPDPVVDDAELREILLTTAAFRSRAKDLMPAPWRLAEVHYSPVVATCALLAYEKQKIIALRLVRVGNPAVRRDRARAHLLNGLRLLEQGDRVGALAETGIAAATAPDYPVALFHHAEQLCVNGQNDAALDQVAAAIKLDASYKRRAADSKDLRDIAWMPRFKALTAPDEER